MTTKALVSAIAALTILCAIVLVAKHPPPEDQLDYYPPDGMTVSANGEARTVDHTYRYLDGKTATVLYHTSAGRSWATGDEWEKFSDADHTANRP